jgi:hypothetical protein
MELGQKVVFNKKYVRKEGRTSDGSLRSWEETSINKASGVFVGIRVLKDVNLIYDEEDGEYNFDWSIHKTTKVALIAINKRGTIYVPLSELNKKT